MRTPEFVGDQMKVEFKKILNENWMVGTYSFLIHTWRTNYGKRNFHSYYCGFNPYFRHILHNSTFIFLVA